MTKFLDAAFPQSATQLESALAHEQAQGFAFYLGGNFALNVWPAWLVTAAAQAGYEAMGIYVTTVVGRDGGFDAQDAVSSNLGTFSRPMGSRITLDLEPLIFRANPNIAASYADAWCQRVRVEGCSPIVYSTPDGCLACGNHADGVWAAVPGNCDPSTIFNPSFHPGMVAVQCGAGDWDGVSYDVSYSEFDLGGNLVLTEGFKVGLAHAIIAAIYNREPTQKELFDFANTLNADGSNLADLVQGLANNLSNPDLHRIQPTTLANQIPGPGGLVPHTHVVPGQATGGPIQS